MHQQRLLPRGVAGNQRDGCSGHSEGPGEQSDGRSVGHALVGHRFHPDTEHDAAVVAGFGALYPVEPGLGGDADEQRDPISLRPVAETADG